MPAPSRFLPMVIPNDPEANGPARPARKLVSPERLLRLLNQRLESYGHCHSCHFVGPIRPLEEPADDGRNWSRFVALVCSSSLTGGCTRIAERIIEDATHEYNLRDRARDPAEAADT